MEIASVRFDIVSEDDERLAEGEAFRLIESDGHIVVLVQRGPDMSEQLRDQLNVDHESIMGSGLWLQDWDGDDNRLSRRPEGLEIAESRWEMVAANDWPPACDRVCRFYEQDGVAIWLIRDPHATAELRDYMNLQLKRIVGDGLWRQSWGGADEAPPS